MVNILTYKFKLYHSKKNKNLHKQISTAALAYNHCIALHKRYYKLFKVTLQKYRLQKHLTHLKKIPKFNYLNNIGSQTLQDITDRIEKSYNIFFRNLKAGLHASPPTFKKIQKYKSFTLKQAGWKLLNGNRLRIGNTIYKYSKSRNILGIIKTVTIKRDSLGDIYIFFVCMAEQNKVLKRTGKSVGYDFGCHKFLTSSDGKDINMPLFFTQNSKDLKKFHGKLSRSKRKSNNHKRILLTLARLHKKITNQKNDFHWKVAYQICSNYSLVCLEDLNLLQLQRRYGKKINEFGFGHFINILDYVACKTGSSICKINRFFASSQICSTCGYQNKEVKNLSIRAWTCPSCSKHHDRDKNAAINILKVGASTFFGKKEEDLA